MTIANDRSYFIVKHDLEAFEMAPRFIWRTGIPKTELPRNFGMVRPGDQWISFAYTSYVKEKALRLVTGFYECTREAVHQKIPLDRATLDSYVGKRVTHAWMIEGQECGEQPKHPVGVPPINDLLGRKTFNQATLVRIDHNEFEHIRKVALSRQFDPRKIPLLGREPSNEQELLATVVYGHKELGIDRIVQVQKAFPDLLVTLPGHSEPVYLELEVYSESFFLHGHADHVNRSTHCYKDDGRHIAVLCWIHNDKSVEKCVHKIYELQSLIRDGKKIVW